jgi:hypothetical protein
VISQVRREQDMQVIIRQGALSRAEPDSPQYGVPPGIGHNLLFDLVATLAAGVKQPEGRHPVCQPLHLMIGITLFLGEKVSAVGDNQTHVAGAGLVNARVVNLVENAVAQGEPNTALVAECRTHAGLGAGCPARRNSRTAGG